MGFGKKQKDDLNFSPQFQFLDLNQIFLNFRRRRGRSFLTRTVEFLQKTKGSICFIFIKRPQTFAIFTLRLTPRLIETQESKGLVCLNVQILGS